MRESILVIHTHVNDFFDVPRRRRVGSKYRMGVLKETCAWQVKD